MNMPIELEHFYNRKRHLGVVGVEPSPGRESPLDDPSSFHMAISEHLAKRITNGKALKRE